MNVRKPEGGEDIPVKVDGGKAQQNKGTPQSSPQFYSNAKLVNLSQEWESGAFDEFYLNISCNYIYPKPYWFIYLI